MKKGLKEMSESLSEELSKMGYKGPGRDYVSKEAASNLILEVIDQILDKIDNCERVLISERCTIRKYSCNSDSIEFKDIRKKDR